MSQIQFDAPNPVHVAERHRVEGGLASVLAAADEFRRHLAEAQSRSVSPPSAASSPPAPSASPSLPEAASSADPRGAAKDWAEGAAASRAEEPVERRDDGDTARDDDRPDGASSTAPADAVAPASTEGEPGAEPVEEVADATNQSGAKADDGSVDEVARAAREAACAAQEMPGELATDAGESASASQAEVPSADESPALRARDESPRDIHLKAMTTLRSKPTSEGKSENELVAGEPPSSPVDSADSANAQSTVDSAQETGQTRSGDSSATALPPAPQGGLPSAAARTASANVSTGRPSRKSGQRAEPVAGQPSDGPRREGESAVAPASASAAAAVSSGDAIDGRAAGIPKNSPNAGASAAPLPSAPAAADASAGAARGTAAISGSTAQPARSAADDPAGGVDRARFVQRVSRAFHGLGDRGGVVRLRLSPPELGSLRLEVSVRDGAISARLEVETQSARQMLLDSLPALRERLAQQDIRIERFSVDLGPRDGGGSPNWPGQDGSAQDRPQPAPIGAPSRSGAARAAEPAPAQPAAPDHGHQLNIIV